MSPQERRGSSSEFEAQYNQLMERYQQALGVIINDHNRTSEEIAVDHSESLNQWLQGNPFRHSASEFDKLVKVPGSRVDANTDYAARSADTVFYASSKDFTQVLSPYDRQLWETVQANVRNRGLTSLSVGSTLDRASSTQAKRAMEAALDKIVWETVQANVRNRGLTSLSVGSTLDRASSTQAKRAMEAALDKIVWETVQANVRNRGLTSLSVGSTLDRASSTQAKRAMEAALDKIVWETVQANVRNRGLTSLSVGSTLDRASSTQAKRAMESLLGDSQRQRTRSTFGDDIPGSKGFDQDFYDQVRRNPFGRTTGRGHRQQQHTTGGQHQRQEPRQTQETQGDVEIEQIIQTVVRISEGQKWLLSEDRKAIKTVVNTVRVVRERAKNDGKEISDRQIYLRYRRAVDQPEGTTPKEELMRSFKILQALMGGGPNGKLPF